MRTDDNPRDERLREALRHAPDAHVRPDPTVRAAIRDMARQAIASPRPPWWQRVWAALDAPKPVWAGATAVAAVAVLTASLWWTEPPTPTEAARRSATPPPATGPSSTLARAPDGRTTKLADAAPRVDTEPPHSATAGALSDRMAAARAREESVAAPSTQASAAPAAPAARIDAEHAAAPAMAARAPRSQEVTSGAPARSASDEATSLRSVSLDGLAVRLQADPPRWLTMLDEAASDRWQAMPDNVPASQAGDLERVLAAAAGLPPATVRIEALGVRWIEPGGRQWFVPLAPETIRHLRESVR